MPNTVDTVKSGCDGRSGRSTCRKATPSSTSYGPAGEKIPQESFYRQGRPGRGFARGVVTYDRTTRQAVKGDLFLHEAQVGFKDATSNIQREADAVPKQHSGNAIGVPAPSPASAHEKNTVRQEKAVLPESLQEPIVISCGVAPAKIEPSPNINALSRMQYAGAVKVAKEAVCHMAGAAVTEWMRVSESRRAPFRDYHTPGPL